MPVVDSSVLIEVLGGNDEASRESRTCASPSEVQERLDSLAKTLAEEGMPILVPTPVLSEILVHAGMAGGSYAEIFNRSKLFKTVSFGVREAIELARMVRETDKGRQLRAGSGATRAKLRFDYQIVATARVRKRKTIYSNDRDIAQIGKKFGVSVETFDAREAVPARLGTFPFLQELTDSEVRGVRSWSRA